MNKSELRSHYKTVRLSVCDRKSAEAKITDRLLESDLFINCDRLFLYASDKTEVSTDAIAENAFRLGKRVAYPVCTDKNGHMEFYFVESTDDLTEGMYGIREPDIKLCERAFPDVNTLVIVPGLAFDTDGNRLGYGKGYYDRFLSEFDGNCVGLAFDECVCDYLPVNAYDKKVDCLITDKKIYKFSITKEE